MAAVGSDWNCCHLRFAGPTSLRFARSTSVWGVDVGSDSEAAVRRGNSNMVVCGVSGTVTAVDSDVTVPPISVSSEEGFYV